MCIDFKISNAEKYLQMNRPIKKVEIPSKGKIIGLEKFKVLCSLRRQRKLSSEEKRLLAKRE